MRYTNATPFPSLCFPSIGPEGPINTVVVRATATIIPASSLAFSDEQLPLNFTDVYFGRPGFSSLKYPSDLAPFKPMADIIVIGTAYPPERGPGGCYVTVKVGRHRKTIAVIAPHEWNKGFFGWTLSKIEGPLPQPIRYEGAFGGSLVLTDREGGSRVVDVHQGNPVGRGWLSPLSSKVQAEVKVRPAPQIFAADTQFPPEFGRDYAVEGLGAIAPAWEFRQRYVGSWEKTAPGHIPEDFDFRFYNCAHPDLTVPYLNGDEKVQLVNLTPGRELAFQLPGHKVVVVARFRNRQDAVTLSANLDTVLIEPDEMRVTLVWRATVPVEAEVQALEARLAPGDMAAERGQA